MTMYIQTQHNNLSATLHFKCILCKYNINNTICKIRSLCNWIAGFMLRIPHFLLETSLVRGNDMYCYTHWANIRVLCNVGPHTLILFGQRHTEQQSVSSLLPNVTLSVNKTNQEREDYKSATTRNGLYIVGYYNYRRITTWLLLTLNLVSMQTNFKYCNDGKNKSTWCVGKWPLLCPLC